MSINFSGFHSKLSNDSQNILNRLDKFGRKSMGEFANELETIYSNFSEDRKAELYSLRLKELSKANSIGIVFLDFETFKARVSFPRCGNERTNTVPLEDIDRRHSFLIFVSHCWLRGSDESPHPDNKNGDKFQLCKRGIELLKSRLAVRVPKCYVWIDYCCMNQDSIDLSEVLENYDLVVKNCDCLFTPIVDTTDWHLPPTINDWYSDYGAKAWNGGVGSYLNSAWCRMEMVFAAVMPLTENFNSLKGNKFDGCLAYHHENNRRPHFLFGSKDNAIFRFPILLPPLKFEYLNKYNPIGGFLTRLEDIKAITTLMDSIGPILEEQNNKVGYFGSFNNSGEPHGYGRRHDNWGNVYEGEFVRGSRNGQGVFVFANGDMYRGNWMDNMASGRGVYFHYDGSYYEGFWACGKKCGQGTYVSAAKDEFVGEWLDNEAHGIGWLKYADGCSYEGEWRNNRRNGLGLFKFSDGSVYKGHWKDDEIVSELCEIPQKAFINTKASLAIFQSTGWLG